MIKKIQIFCPVTEWDSYVFSKQYNKYDDRVYTGFQSPAQALLSHSVNVKEGLNFFVISLLQEYLCILFTQFLYHVQDVTQDQFFK